MDIKNQWNKYKYWQKGSLLCFSSLTIFVILFAIWINFTSLESSDPHVPFYLGFVIMFIVYVVPGTIIGGIIGFFIDKYKK